jgi:O-phospho-L-seryl-tRNASec:L-selenocysteinyl-tRNA synthase
MIQKLGKIYAGRASSAPILDLFITLLSLGLNGYKNLLERRRKLTIKFQEKLSTIAQNQGERILKCPKNTISFGITLDTLAKDLGVNEKKNAEITSLFGSMLFTRCVSGTRVVSKNQIKIIAGQEFIGFGSSTDGYPHSYLTAACAIGLSEVEMEEFFVRLEKCFKDFRSKMMKKLSSSSSVTVGLKSAE